MRTTKKHVPCTWCREDADALCFDIHGRSEPLGPGGYGPLCEPCQQVNDYLWDSFVNPIPTVMEAA
ncbi:hypothetical protein IU451_28910 [Nocardia cyriacigeorgica]|uniref:hypothetical protein n=1 Tax=Nocardia cyriacigeorgica TaxID=135487 RepID=UPI0018945069|nr:hypothetical protein [Nocardia cyriacigeorgica]MBF6326524.1 hypothetical protein [Nocardia cyriacigeorgica]